MKIFETIKIIEFFINCTGKMVRARAGAGIFDKLELQPEPQKNGPAPQCCSK
jgi:hypothetical protein